MEKENDENINAIEQVYEYAANLLFKENKSIAETKAAIISNGISEEIATLVVSNIIRQIKEAKTERAKKDITYGAIWCVGGIIVTAVTYSAASGGGTYVVAWGAILIGAIQLIKGLLNSFA